MLRRISGKRKDKNKKYPVTDSDTITNKTDITETLDMPRTPYQAGAGKRSQ